MALLLGQVQQATPPSTSHDVVAVLAAGTAPGCLLFVLALAASQPASHSLLLLPMGGIIKKFDYDVIGFFHAQYSSSFLSLPLVSASSPSTLLLSSLMSSSKSPFPTFKTSYLDNFANALVSKEW